MSTQSQNECKFGHWEELAHGGRCYWFEVAGRRGWKARYVKEVDANENTVRFWQEIYNEGQRTSKAIATLDLAVPNYIPAHWTDASAMPPVERKHKNPQRTRRKNV